MTPNIPFGYIVIDKKKRVLNIWNIEQILPDVKEDFEVICVEDATVPEALFDENGVPRYRWNGSKITARTEKAITSDTDPVESFNNIDPDNSDDNTAPSFEFSDAEPDTPPLLNGGD